MLNRRLFFAACIALGVLAGYLLVTHFTRTAATGKRAAAAASTAEHAGRAAVERENTNTAAAATARADSTLTHVLTRPPLPRPTVVTVAAPAPGVPAGEYVSRGAYDSLRVRADSLATAATIYRDSVRVLAIRFPRLVAELDSVTRFQRVEIATPAPRRRCSLLSVTAGPGLSIIGHLVEVSTAQITVGVGCSL